MIHQTEVIDLLQCPVCSGKLASVNECAACGESFDSEAGTPRLISARSRRKVEYVFDASQSTASPNFYAAFNYPPREKRAAHDLPHHLDPAHIHHIARLPNGGRVLEIGCGGGQMRPWFIGQGFRYVGTDISKVRVGPDLQRYGGPDFLCDAHFLPFRDRCFDLVYSAAVTEHIAEPHLMMNEVHRVLRPGGTYLGNVSFMEPWHDDSYFHMSPLGAYRALTRSGFEVKHVWPGVGYTGYTALFDMGNKVSKAMRVLGMLGAFGYRLGMRLRRRLGHAIPRGGQIELDARIAGASDWIAVKPLHSEGP